MTDAEIVAELLDICGTDNPGIALMRARYDRLAVVDTESTYGVYAQINNENYVTAIESDAFIEDLSWWIKVDEGTGELYKYARVNYCKAGLVNDAGTYNYKLINNKVVYSPQSDQPSDHEILMTLMGVEETV